MLKPPVSQCHTATPDPCSVKAFYVESLGMKRSKAPARSLWPPFHGSMHHCTFKNWVTLFFFSYIALLDHKRPPSRSIPPSRLAPWVADSTGSFAQAVGKPLALCTHLMITSHLACAEPTVGCGQISPIYLQIT